MAICCSGRHLSLRACVAAQRRLRSQILPAVSTRSLSSASGAPPVGCLSAAWFFEAEPAHARPDHSSPLVADCHRLVFPPSPSRLADLSDPSRSPPRHSNCWRIDLFLNRSVSHLRALRDLLLPSPDSDTAPTPSAHPILCTTACSEPHTTTAPAAMPACIAGPLNDSPALLPTAAHHPVCDPWPHHLASYQVKTCLNWSDDIDPTAIITTPREETHALKNTFKFFWRLPSPIAGSVRQLQQTRLDSPPHAFDSASQAVTRRRLPLGLPAQALLSPTEPHWKQSAIRLARGSRCHLNPRSATPHVIWAQSGQTIAH